MLLVAGCASVGPGEQAPPPPAPSGTPTLEPVLSLSDVFGGVDGCNKLVPETTVSQAMGSGATVREFRSSDLRFESAVEIRGGVQCLWDGASPFGLAALAVFPGTGSVPTSGDDLTCTGSQSGSDATCDFGLSANGYWISGAVDVGPGPNEEQVTAATQPIIDSSRASVEALAPGSPFVEAAGTWANIDCASIALDSDLRGLLGRPALEESSQYGGGVGEIRAPSFLDAYLVTNVFCPWTVPNAPTTAQDFSFTAHPGGGIIGDRMAQVPGATLASVSGIDRVVLIADGQLVAINAFDGANWLEAWGPAADVELYLSVIPALMAALDAA